MKILGLFKHDRTVDGIQLLGFRPGRNRFSRFLMTNCRIFLRSIKERAAVYHFHDIDFIPWAVLLKFITGSKVIYDIHEAYPEYILIKTYIPKRIRKILSRSIRILELYAIKLFDGIIPNDNFISQSFNHKHNITIFNFPTLDFFRGRNGTPWHRRKYDLFYHGSLPKYHFEAMMAIAERLNSEKIAARWGIVTKDDPTVGWAKHELTKRNLISFFDFLPYTDYLNVFEYLNMAKIGIIPLPPYEKFMKNIPLKMFEFMGCGLPIVLSDLPPSRQFIEGKDCAIAVDPENIDEYAKAIKLLLNDPQMAEKMGENGKRLIFEKYNWDNEQEKLLTLYCNFCG